MVLFPIGLVCLILLSLTVFPVASRAHADEVADSYKSLQEHPESVRLNLRYAELAEQAGKLKWALPAYERALAADPENSIARAGIDRIKARLREEAEAPPAQ